MCVSVESLLSSSRLDSSLHDTLSEEYVFVPTVVVAPPLAFDGAGYFNGRGQRDTPRQVCLNVVWETSRRLAASGRHM